MSSIEIMPSSMPRMRKLQLVVWPVLAVLYFGFDFGRQGEAEWIELVWRSLTWGLVGLFVSSLLAQLYRLTKAGTYEAIPFALTAIVGSLVGGVVWLFLFACLDGMLALEDGWSLPTEWHLEHLFVELMDYSLMLLVWHGVLFSATQVARSNEQQRRALELEQRATESQLIALRAQLNPHFLFNALNSAMALVHDAPDRAEDVLQRLAGVLRRSLAKTGSCVALQDEITLVSDYLGIEKVRFEERLHVELDIDERLRQVRIPPGLVLPLVDNAIKHGLNHSEGGMNLYITATRSRGRLEIVVGNSGTLAQSTHTRSLGLGLTNVRQRVAAEFSDLGEFSLVEVNGSVEARLLLPLEQTGGNP